MFRILVARRLRVRTVLSSDGTAREVVTIRRESATVSNCADVTEALRFWCEVHGVKLSDVVYYEAKHA